MKQKTKKILISALILLTTLFIGAYLRLPSKEVIFTPEDNQVEQNIKEKSIVSTAKEVISLHKSNGAVSQIPEVKIKATVVVADKSYDASIPENKNIYDLMNVLMDNSKESNFTFHAKEYRGMGYFVDMINGIYGSPGAYWIYYINNKKATVGISQYIVKDGDIIRWAQEGI
jgi:hypothetical protein